MRHVFFGLVLVLLTGCEQSVPPVPWSGDMQTVADGNNKFAIDLYRQLAQQPGNLFFSPFSAHAALAMTAAGANGPTRDEMVKVLYLPDDRAKALAAGDLSRYYTHGSRGCELAVANAIWGQKGEAWKPEFLAVQKDRFGAGFQEADFRGNPSGERERINAWAEEHTRGKIVDLLKPEDITSQVVMVLANAIYFKGEWTAKFDPKRTHDAPFLLADGTQKPVPMMNRTGGFRLHVEPGRPGVPGDGFEVIELPYSGDHVSMVFLVPNRPSGLPGLVERLSADALAGWLAALDSADAPARKMDELSVPKFRLTSEHRLKEPLQALGIRAAFGDADFTGMRDGDRVPVTRVVQKAFVDVNEEGTEAAAATAVVKALSGTREYQVNRPFLFLIRDVKHGTILFLGRYETP